MVSDVQKLFTSASFPPELRTQVMKAGVPYNTICKLSSHHSMKSVEGLRNEAHGLLLFPPREHWYQLDVWADEETSNIIRSTAEQAFFETAIFKLCINNSLRILEDEDWTSGLSSIPAIIGSSLHYLELNTVIGFHPAWCEQGLELYLTWCRKAATHIEKFTLHFPNLKACVLTLDLDFSSTDEPPLQPFDQMALEWTTWTSESINFVQTSLTAETSSLFGAFATKGPGKSRFIRIRCFPGAFYDGHTNGTVHYGPLVKVDGETMAAEPEKGSLGTKLFRDAYRLARSGQQPAIETRVLGE